MRGSNFSMTDVFYPSDLLDSASGATWQSAAWSLLLTYCYVQPGFELYHNMGVQINIPYKKDMYVLSRISTSSWGSIDEISILRLTRELNCEIVREVMSGLITSGVAMPTFQVEDFFVALGRLFCCVCFFFLRLPSAHSLFTKTVLGLVWGSLEHLLRITMSKPQWI